MTPTPAPAAAPATASNIAPDIGTDTAPYIGTDAAADAGVAQTDQDWRADPASPADRRTGSSSAPGGRAMWRASRWPVLAVALLVLASVVAAVLRAGGDAGRLDPRSYSPGGSRAVAQLLSDRGVAVHVVGDLPGLRSSLRPATTVLVPLPGALTSDELAELGRLDAPLVVTGAGQSEVDALGLAVDAQPVGTTTRRPACDLEAAAAAGPARAGGVSYRPRPSTAAVGCYAAAGAATVLVLPGSATTLVGAPDLLTNDELDTEGDAALALGLLGAGDQVLWLLPSATRGVPGGQVSLRDLLPDAVPLGALQLFLAVGLLALWRARRLGRVVVEPLPVVVRAAEAVEGRGRLYRAAGARATAAEALRAGVRDRLAHRLGLPPDATRGALVATLAARTSQDPQRVDALLYGPPPSDDRDLVRLADALDSLSP